MSRYRIFHKLNKSFLHYIFVYFWVKLNYVVSDINYFRFIVYNLEPGYTINTFALGIKFKKKSGLVLLTHRRVFFFFGLMYNTFKYCLSFP